jgi:hypothetical protein
MHEGEIILRRFCDIYSITNLVDTFLTGVVMDKLAFWYCFDGARWLDFEAELIERMDFSITDEYIEDSSTILL